jgi:hypothetical protein
MAKTPKFSGLAANSNGDFAGTGKDAEDGSRIHSSGEFAAYSNLMPEILSDGKTPYEPTQFLEPQHRNFDAPAYGDDGHRFSMDNVDRNSFPLGDLGIEVLESRIMGVDDFTPPANRSTSTQSRAPRIPTRSGAGDASRTGNSHPLNAGGSPARHGQNKA